MLFDLLNIGIFWFVFIWVYSVNFLIKIIIVYIMFLLNVMLLILVLVDDISGFGFIGYKWFVKCWENFC